MNKAKSLQWSINALQLGRVIGLLSVIFTALLISLINDESALSEEPYVKKTHNLTTMPHSPTEWNTKILNEKVVRIKIQKTTKLNIKSQNIETMFETGVGVVIDDQGHILTCAHVLDEHREGKLFITRCGLNTEYEASLVYLDRQVDLAVIKVSASGLTPLSIKNNHVVAVGEEVMLAGFPTADVYKDNYNLTFSWGYISHPYRKLRITAGRNYSEGVLQLQAWSDHGFSGGPVLDRRGNVLGIIFSRIEKDGTWNGYTLATPAKIAARFLRDFRESQTK